MSRRSPFQILIGTVLVVCLSQAGLGAENNIFVAQPTVYSGPDFMPGQIIVQFRVGVPESVIAQMNEKNQAKVAYRSQSARFRVLSFPEAIPPQAMANIYAHNPNVEYAELNYIAHASVFPNDPRYRLQWHLDNATYGGIGMEEAWPLSTGTVTVAVVDTGVREGGPDGIGTIIRGRDFVNGDNDPTDDHGHGTHVAGTIAQQTNNGVGVAGVAPGCSILAVKVLDAGGSGAYAWVADGIRYAADHGAKVINMSLGGRSASTTLESALAYAYGQGVTIVCASGNDGSPTRVHYPAAYNAYCIAVGATRYDEAVAYYSNCGSALDLTAPGGDLTVDQNGDGYGDGVLQETYYSGGWGYWFFQGTSMATPHVAGVAALVIAKGIATSPDEVRNVLQSTAKDRGASGWDSRYGWGIVDAYAALTYGQTNQAPTASFTYAATYLEVVFTDTSTDNDGSITAWSWDFGDGGTSIEQNPTHTYDSGGPYTVTLEVTDNGGATDTTSQSFTVTEPPNQAPVASFTYTKADLTCNVDASASYDADGTIASYAWAFGDGATDTGVTASHTYSAGGTYTVTLTVTDDGGATGTSSRQITVSASAGSGTLHVASLTGEAKDEVVGRFRYVTAYANVTVVDGDGKAVLDAEVTGQWSVAATNVATDSTDDSGLAVLASSEVKARKKMKFVLTITNVQKAGYTYDDGGQPPSVTIDWP
jgi:serine protease